jgi:small GTP-binding protein
MKYHYLKMKIALVGLPSAGKSTIINSLIGQRVIPSGATRTTTEAKLYQNLTSDDHIKFDIYDLPGMTDVHEPYSKLDATVFDIVTKCDLVFWVSDINKAFSTQHEKTRCNDIRLHINNMNKHKGSCTQFVIMLNKVNDIIETHAEPSPTTTSGFNEIETDEDIKFSTTYESTCTQFPGVEIVLFNAYGRAAYHQNSSKNLKTFAMKNNPKNCNTEFVIGEYFNMISGASDRAKIKYFVETELSNIVPQSRCSLPFDLPDNLILWCDTYQCLVNECMDENCGTCRCGIFQFRCKAHQNKLCYNNGARQYIPTQYNTTYVNGFGWTNSCADGCVINFQYGNKDDGSLACKHGCVPGHIMCRTNLNLMTMGQTFNKIFTELHQHPLRKQLLSFILFDNNEIFSREIEPSGVYDANSWNILATHIQIPKMFMRILIPKSFIVSRLHELTTNQIFRILTIGKYDDEFELTMYSSPNCKTIKVGKNFFIKENIYELSYFTSKEHIKLKNVSPDQYLDTPVGKSTNEKNQNIGLLIYNDNFVSIVKAIRKLAFGKIEDTVSVSAIQMAYDKYGLFWKPIEHELI